jgi:gamma-aminobutyric acid type B receptor
MLSGSIFAYITAMLLVSPPSADNCVASTWIGHIAFALLYGSLFAKTFRVAKIFNLTKLTPMKLSNTRLLSFVGLSVLFTIIYLIVWTTDPVGRPQIVQVSRDNIAYDVCQSGRKIYPSIILAVEGLTVLCGVYVCIRLRNIPSMYNESTQIATTIYNMLVLGGFIVLVSNLGISQPHIAQLFEAAGIVVITSISVIIIFYPKLRLLYSRDALIEAEEINKKYNITDTPEAEKDKQRTLASAAGFFLF